MEKPASFSCSVDGCAKSVLRRGWCSAHYQKWRKYGDPTVGRTYARGDSVDAFWSYVEKTDGCWNWVGVMGAVRDGNARYGRFHHRDAYRRTGKRSEVLAHRFAYETFVGPIPDGGHIDHICRNTRCVRPDHLRIVTAKQNQEHRGPQRNTKSGVRGVSWDANRNKWQCHVMHNMRSIFVGRFNTLEEAAAAVRSKRNELFTHNNLDREAV